MRDALKISRQITLGKTLTAPSDNHLLSALPTADLQRWLPYLEEVNLTLGQVIYESGEIISCGYFPTSAIISILYVMKGGDSAEIAVIGWEGLLGTSVFMGGGSTPSRAVVQNAGVAYRIKAEILKEGFERSVSVSRLLLRYTQSLMAQMTQTAACNRHHTLDQQLCRWLLLSLDRHSGNELLMTRKLISNMLGATEEKMTQGAISLADAGLVKYNDGRILVLDRQGLEQRTCECYQVVKKEYDRLLEIPRA